MFEMNESEDEQLEDEPGGDTEPVEEDVGDLSQDHEVIDNKERLPDTPYYQSQIILANEIIDRIEEIYDKYHKRKKSSSHLDKPNLRSFTDFDFRIYTANSNMLQRQTIARLSEKYSGCLDETLYENSDSSPRLEAATKVHKYNLNTVKHEHGKPDNSDTGKPQRAKPSLCEMVTNNPDTLFLIVADEAHWGATGVDQANSVLVNNWTKEEHPNVIVLLVTATPYNLLTEHTRIPSERFSNNRSKVNNSELLHQVRWTKSFEERLKDSVTVILRAPFKAVPKTPDQLFIYLSEDKKLIFWSGGDSTQTNPNNISKFSLTGHSNEVMIKTADGKRQLIVRERNVGFVELSDLKRQDIINFEIKVHYGEGCILFKVPGGDSYLAYDAPKRRIVLQEPRMPKETEMYPVPPLECTFLIDELRSSDSQGLVTQYLSMNHYWNSMRHEDPEDQLIKNDEYFSEMATKIMKKEDIQNYKTHEIEVEEELYRRGGEAKEREQLSETKNSKKEKAILCDILSAEYSYYILIIPLLRDYPIKVQDIRNCFSDFIHCAGEYPEKREKSIEAFMENLDMKKMPDNIDECESKIYPISSAFFQNILAYLKVKVLNDFERYLKKFKNNPKNDIAIELLSSIVACLMHLNIRELKEVQYKMAQANIQDNLIQSCNCNQFDFEETMNVILIESETGKITNNLIPNDLQVLDGSMKIIRVSTKVDGNKMYRTLCIARSIYCKSDYSFEILRDYDGAEFIHNKNATEEEQKAKYRLRKRLQRRKCKYLDRKTHESCDCYIEVDKKFRPTYPNLICLECKHVHNPIEKYTDVEGLPCLLILINKGRLGDTFPQSFDVMDLRLCYRKKGTLYLSRIMQELGRLCRYQVPSDKRNMPYAIVGKHLIDTIRKALQIGATYYASLQVSYMQLDCKTILEKKTSDGQNETSKENEEKILPKENHSDYVKPPGHENRILLRAEPQIGKTGVYLKTISMLRQIICSHSHKMGCHEESDVTDDETEEDADDDNETEEDEDDDVKDKGTENISHWIYPHWTSMDKAPDLKKSISAGRYPVIYGDYIYGNDPPVVLPFKHRSDPLIGLPLSKYKKQEDREHQKIPENSLSDRKFKAYSYKEHNSCTDCTHKMHKTNYETQVLLLRLKRLKCSEEEEMKFEISVPLSDQFNEILKYIKKYVTTEFTADIKSKQINIASAESQLKTWIFIPSYGRPDTAHVNLHHTMVNKNRNYEQCQYISLLVVRRSEFVAYYQLWQSTHAILQIPDTLPGEDIDAYEGGIGYARLAIQLFVESLKLDWIFVLDDNIPYTYEIKESNSVVKREKGKLIEDNVPLFNVLKHIETQIDGSVTEPPARDLKEYPQIDPTKNLEKYTGPADRYAVIGVKKSSGTIGLTKRPFAKTHVHSFKILNINKLKETGIYYKPWQVYEDMRLNNECDEKKLWVCKYNRFTIHKHHMNTWIPEVFYWTDKTELMDSGLPVAKNSSNILIAWLRSTCRIRMPEEQYKEGEHERSEEQTKNKEEELEIKKILEKLMKYELQKSKQTGKHKIFKIGESDDVIQGQFLSIREQEHMKKGTNKFVIMISRTWCIKRLLNTKSRIVAWLMKLMSDVKHTVEVVTSHEVKEYRVNTVLVIVQATTISPDSLQRKELMKEISKICGSMAIQRLLELVENLHIGNPSLEQEMAMQIPDYELSHPSSAPTPVVTPPPVHSPVAGPSHAPDRPASTGTRRPLCPLDSEEGAADDPTPAEGPPMPRKRGKGQVDPPERLVTSLHHSLTRIEAGRRRRCRVCAKGKVRKDTSWECDVCDIALCVKPCFKLYHTYDKYW